MSAEGLMALGNKRATDRRFVRPRKFAESLGNRHRSYPLSPESRDQGPICGTEREHATAAPRASAGLGFKASRAGEGFTGSSDTCLPVSCEVTLLRLVKKGILVGIKREAKTNVNLFCLETTPLCL